MAFTIYEASIPPLIKGLENLSGILDKATTQSNSEGKDLNALLDGKLAPDMFAFTRQVQIVSDTAKGCAARLAGAEPPNYPDEEKSFPELKQRLARTIDYLKSFRPAQFDGAESRTITLKFPQRTLSFSGSEYVTGFVLPNFYFHTTTAYAILRHSGIAVGKMDFLGPAPA